MNVLISLSNDDVKRLIAAEVQRLLGEVPIDPKAVSIEVKTSQNYKAEWETGQFRVNYDTNLLPYDHKR